MMISALGLAASLALASCHAVQVGAVHVGSTTLTLSGRPGAYEGLTVTVTQAGRARQVANLLLQAGGTWTARSASEVRDGARRGLELRDFSTAGTGGTPTLGRDSFVRLTLAPGETYPRLDFRFDITAFDPAAWQAAQKQKAPLSFLALPLPAARVWYVHGLLCPTPTWDPYPLSRPTIGASWARGWSYGVALGALTVPAMALWDDRHGQMVGYEWAEARFTDKSSKDLGIAYCDETPRAHEEFLTLLSNPQQDWTELSYPKIPLTVASHLRILYSLDLPATADVNRLVLRHIYRDYRAILPRVPRMNDLSWMVSRRLDELGNYGPSGGGFLSTIKGGVWGWSQMFFDPGTVLYNDSFRGVDQMYKQHNAEAIARFDKDLTTFLNQVHWGEPGPDRSCYWRYPLEGSWNTRMGGEAADTMHNVQQFGVGAAMLACYADTGRKDLLPYIDGLFNWAHHYVFTRGDISDIPESMFTLQTTTLAMQFLMNYAHVFAKAPDAFHRRRAGEAFDLADMVVYRNANVTLGDSDERDNLSGAFMMPGNMAKFWLGQISNAELSMPFRSMIMMAVETGDPVFEWLVRGALDRWWIGYKEDCWHTAENIDIWGVSTGTKGEETGIHGPCDDFWEWAEPVGDSVMHVTCGAKAAMAFCKGTRALDVADYSYAPPANFRFRVVAIGPSAPAGPFSIIVSSPWRDFSGAKVTVDGKPAQGLRVLGTYHEHLYLRGVRPGSVVEVGDVGGARTLPLPSLPVAKGPADVPAAALHLDGRTFALADLSRQATVALPDDWDAPDHWGGLPVGLAYAWGVPYDVRARAAGPGATLRLTGREAYLLASVKAPGAVRVTTGGRETSFGPGDGLLAASGWPVCTWKLRLLPVRLVGGRGEARVGEGGLVLGVTSLREGPGLAAALAAKAAAPAVAPKTGPSAAVLAEAKRRLDAAGGPKRAPMAFLPPEGPICSSLMDEAARLGVAAAALSPEDLVDPAVFNARRFPVAVYTGVEQYLRTVKTPGDGEQALLRYLGEGGLLVVAGPCRPFTYAIDTSADGEEKVVQQPWALFGKKFDLFLLGPQEKTADAEGFETPPRDDLTMHLAPGQPVFWAMPAVQPFPREGDLRYRPLTTQGMPAEAEVTPLLVTRAPAGHTYGPAAALVRHTAGPFKGAQVLWVWGTLLQPPYDRADDTGVQVLTYAETAARKATQPLPPSMAMALPPGHYRVAILPPNCGGREDLIRRACKAAGATPVFLTPDEFVTPSFFNAANFPVAVQAVDGESFILTYRTDGDGEAAYKRYLSEGGTMIVCQPATPFHYEMLWQGGKWKTRPPQRFWSMSFDLGFETAYGFEKPPAPMRLELTAEGRRLWPRLAQPLVLNYLTDQRWRSLIPYRSSAARRFVPLGYATKPDGERYSGLAAARIDFIDSKYGGARLYYLWGNMVEGQPGEEMLAGCLRDNQTQPPTGHKHATAP